MKKKLLFVMNHLQCGGAEKALVSLLQVIDYQQYEVDLLLFKPVGIFLKQIPKEVNVLPSPHNYQYFDMSLKTVVVNCMKRGDLKNLLVRLYLNFVMHTEKNEARREQLAWRHIVRTFRRLENEYDAAIGFLEKSPIYYVIDRVKAKRKLGWVHTNYSSLKMDAKIDGPYFDKLDYVVTVSQECMQSLRNEFVPFTAKFKIISNIISPAIIKNMSMEEIGFSSAQHVVRIVTVSRLSYVKGIDLAIKACKQLVDRGYVMDWEVFGYGTEKEFEENQTLIDRYGLQSHFKLLGVVENPYPYLRKAQIVVQPSRFEGKSIAIDEAKILNKPIVVTNFSTVNDQINHEVNGLIVEMNPEAIADGIERFIGDELLRSRVIRCLSAENLGTESEVHKLYELVN
ncbi:glycosyltransferase [Paenibacillus sp. PAMC21692]|uniref:glycosyltransferase n=1 Tax=Paenibacillus sp. PAMC21692 TaxID=2762320 RepID=UPI00164EC07E|nr:glycosyltransferase [Paenibacillus sp. PAMC21692]QNK59875.1 glycosyltransferase [Paenibacillus sp. PAMC21692]